MEEFAVYLIRSVIWLTGFALVYMFFLKDEKFFFLIRLYLVAGILISFVFPLISLHYIIVMPAVNDFQVNKDALGEVQNLTSAKVFDLRYIFTGLYLSGVIFLLTRVIMQIRLIIKMIRKSEVTEIHSKKLIRTTEYTSSFSFFSYVFVNHSFTDVETKEIVNHEMAHITQKHWIDLALAELLCMMQWFNPIVWIYRRVIKQNHEYLADEVALQKTSDPAIYKAILLNHIVGIPVIRLGNSFNYSLNSKRFYMMKHTISSPWRKLKIFLILPLFVIILYSFATPEYHYISSAENDMIIGQAPVIFFRELKGYIVNEDGKPLGGVTIVVSGTSLGAVSDRSGYFVIGNVADEASLVLSFPGYKTQIIKPVFGSDMNIRMYRDSDNNPSTARIRLDNKTPESPPIVIIDGIISGKGVEGIHPDDIASISVLKDRSATDKYGEKGKDGIIEITTKKTNHKGSQNTMSDVKVNGYANKPEIDTAGQVRKIMIRNGNSSKPGNNPLIVIDGIVTDIDLNEIDVMTIQSISVLKDKSSTNKYGESGINGVIEITTKKNEE